MKDRIVLLIKAKNLTAAQFADEIGVQKSSISHIISGRNNASLDFIQKVLLRYPEVNMEWLMFGKGQLFKGSENSASSSNEGLSSTTYAQNVPPVDLFSELRPGQSTDFRNDKDLIEEQKTEESNKRADLEKAALFPATENFEQLSGSQIKKSDNVKSNSGHENSTTKSILKIVEFYADNTFREYFPE